MRKYLIVLFALVSALFSVSCESLLTELQPPSELSLSFSEEMYNLTKSRGGIKDSNDFIIKITASKDDVIFKGFYGDLSPSLELKPGKYTIEIFSSEFSVPRFNTPQYGDVQSITLSSGSSQHIELLCRQINCGVKLNISSSFLTTHPSSVLYLSSEDGRLMYGYSERQIAYFNPGEVSLLLSTKGKEEVLLTRNLNAGEILSLNVNSVSPEASDLSFADRLSVTIDTSRVWLYESFTIGQGSSQGGSSDNAMSVGEALNSIGAEDVWVYGYIVGGDLSSSSASFAAPFSSRTNLLLGSKSSVTSRSSCLSVQLSKGDIRDELNLVDNPSLLRSKLFLKGDIVESYYGIPGIQNVSEYRWE